MNENDKAIAELWSLHGYLEAGTELKPAELQGLLKTLVEELISVREALAEIDKEFGSTRS